MRSWFDPSFTNSRILDPTGFRLNICPWRISRTIAPSCPWVARTVFATLYMPLCLAPVRDVMHRTFSLTLEERQKKFGIFGKPTAVLGSCRVSVRCPRLFREFVVQDVHFCALFFKIEL